MYKGLGRGEGFAWPWYLSAHLPAEVDTSAVFPLQDLDANIVRWHHEPPDAPVCGPQKSDSDTSLDVYSRRRVGLPPLCFQTTGYPFQGSTRLGLHIIYKYFSNHQR